MQFFEEEIEEYAKFAWSTLNLEVTSSKEPFDINSENSITANIQINGKWQGVVALMIGHDLAQQLAVKMFSMEPGQVSDEEVNDALSEMINIIGGNLKSLLPQPNQLSLPLVDLQGNGLQFPFTEQLSQVVFDCMGKKFMVTIHQSSDNKLQVQPSEGETTQAS